MRSPGEVVLVSCYELGHQPIGLASPLGFLERAGFAPLARDLAVEKLDDALPPELLARARFVGISVPMHTALRMGVVVARRVHALAPQAHVCFYGLYAPLHGDYLLGTGSGSGGRALADSVIGGEYEEALVARVEAVAAQQEGALSPAPAPTLARLDFAAPSRDALPRLERYAGIDRGDGRVELAGYIEASRGCLHRCRHCPIPALYDGRFFVVPEALVLADVQRQVAAGATHVTFGDPDFLNGPRHTLAVARALHREFPRLTFDVTAKIEHLLRHRALLPELAELGCVFIVSAVESLSDRVLEILNKGHTRADVEVAIEATHAAGIRLRPSLVPFTPWETLESYLSLYHFIDEHQLWDAIDPVHMTIRLLVPPGSLLLDHPEMRPHLGALDAERLTWQWVHPDPRMDALQAQLAEVAANDARAGADPITTTARLRHLAHTAAGRAHRPLPASPRRRSPKLTETWFC